MFNVVLADPPEPYYLEWMQAALPDGMELAVPPPGDEMALYALVREADFLLTRKRFIGRELIRAGKHLRLIQQFGLTRDLVDLAAAREVGIPVAGMPLAGAMAVAELVMTLLLALSKNLRRAHEATADGEYRKLGLEPKTTSQSSIAFQWMRLPAVEVYGKTLGIVGLGEIGLETARRARAFRMRIVYHKRKRLPEERERAWGASYRLLDDLLRESDFVSLSVPHTQETDRLIGKRELDLMKPSAFLINTCRGGVVDEDALYQVLAAGRIAGTGLDVFRKEPLPAESPLAHLENVILTPHIGGGSGEPNLIQEVHDVLENVARVANGEHPWYVETIPLR
ncbi:MAG TPA: hypothetical protein DEP84_03425 [Chloroflexi bacterium]|nr:hypothetical protein [Chloroflexota bacterium]